MSLEISVVRTKFETLDETGCVVAATYGARVYDNFGNAYVNLLQTRDELTALDRADLLDFVRDNSEAASLMLSTMEAAGARLFVDEEEMEWS